MDPGKQFFKCLYFTIAPLCKVSQRVYIFRHIYVYTHVHFVAKNIG